LSLTPAETDQLAFERREERKAKDALVEDYMEEIAMLRQRVRELTIQVRHEREERYRALERIRRVQHEEVRALGKGCLMCGKPGAYDQHQRWGLRRGKLKLLSYRCQPKGVEL